MLRPKLTLLGDITPTVSPIFHRSGFPLHPRILSISQRSGFRYPDSRDNFAGNYKHHHSWSISHLHPLSNFVRPNIRVRFNTQTPITARCITSTAILQSCADPKQPQFPQPQRNQLNEEDPLIVTRRMEPSNNSSEAEGDIRNNETKQQQSDETRSTAASSQAKEQEPALPPLTPAEFKTFNRLADQMDYFHEHFRSIWKTLYTACTNNKRPANLSLKQFLDEGLRLTQYLEAHHSIEENYLYPILAKKMPQFAPTGKRGKLSKGASKEEECDLLRQHQEIHRGMDVFSEYLKACKNRETELDLSVLKEKMDSWGDVLFQHLDDEVKELEAENMRKYWTLAEVKVIPM